ncbi:hypothetical protein [Streptomyces sp. 5-10]|uniref:hypothetical protein n=1 Tax=Streptomyces sp. 5-10 TaxID=878925 RepID=UPI00168B48F4|nr:hypothetical protein [Streptomyces sp. 5-10]MBD3004656.1 hypothetical protein [Streptomyces sp. 5-10]
MTVIGPSSIENLLGIKFESDPRQSRFPLPRPPKGHPKDKPYTKNSFVLTRDVARDWLTYRVIRRELTPPDLVHSDFRDNRRFLVDYAKDWAKIFSGQSAEKYNPNTHEGAAFSREIVGNDEFLLDAQHRFAGFLLSGIKSIEIPVTTGVDWAAFAIMNKGRRRNVGQMLGDLPYAHLAAGVARHLLPVVDGSEREKFTIPGRDEDVIDIARGWPHFRGPWLKEVMGTLKSRIPMSPLGATVIGTLAAGGDPFEVQQFIDGLKPGYREGYPSIGTDGEDPRRLLKLAFTGRDPKQRYSEAEQRVNAGMIRQAMNVWMRRHDDKPIKYKTLPRTPAHRQLPPFWQADKIRAFHDEHVS